MISVQCNNFDYRVMSNSMLLNGTGNSNMNKISGSKRVECSPKYNDRANANRWIKLYHKVQGLLCYSMKKSSKSSRRKKQKQFRHDSDDECSIDFSNTKKKNTTQSSNSTMIRLISRKMNNNNAAAIDETMCDYTQQTDHTETYHESVPSMFFLQSVLQQFHDIELPCILNDQNNTDEYHLHHHIPIPDSFYSFFKDAQESLQLLMKDKPTTTLITDSRINNHNNTKDGDERKENEDITDVQYIRYETFVPLGATTYYKTLPTIMEIYGEEDNEYVEYQEEFGTSYNWNGDESSYISSVSMGVISSCSSRGQGTIISV